MSVMVELVVTLVNYIDRDRGFVSDVADVNIASDSKCISPIKLYVSLSKVKRSDDSCL